MTRRRLHVGARASCAVCGLDIEYFGLGTWLDRGGNRYCATSGAAKRDADGVPVEFPPDQQHTPYMA